MVGPGGQARSKGLPTDPRTHPSGGRDMVRPGGWGLVDNKRNTHHKIRQKRKLTVSENTKQVIQDYDTVFDNSIPFRKNDLLRITYHTVTPKSKVINTHDYVFQNTGRAGPALCALAPRQPGGCLGAAAPVRSPGRPQTSIT